MKQLTRLIVFILKAIVALSLIALLCAAGFSMSMNYSSLYVMLNDGMRERANVILYNNDTSSMSKYYTSYFMENDSYIALRDKYSSYTVNSFGYELRCGSLLTWPWATTAVITVDEAVYMIDGAIKSSVKGRETAQLDGTYYPPAWQNCRYRVTLVKSDGQWRIDKLEYLEDFAYVQPTQRSLPPEVLASLRPTPTVRPSATPVPDVTDTPEPTYKGYIDGVDSTVNVRSGPGTNYDILGTLKKKDTVLIYSLEENWYCIDFNGTKGYVHKQYVAFDNNEE